MRIHELINEIGVGRARTFKGSPCTNDCSGHTAGYNWGKKKSIKNPNNCPPGGSKSFQNGCKIAGSGK